MMSWPNSNLSLWTHLIVDARIKITCGIFHAGSITISAYRGIFIDSCPDICVSVKLWTRCEVDSEDDDIDIGKRETLN